MRHSRPVRHSARVAAILLAASALAGVTSVGSAAGGGTGGVGPGGPTGSNGEFPIRGAHEYGDGLGAGRGHQGQDLFAKCGKRLVAAQPGRVQLRDYQAGGAGNYLVIDGKGKLADTVYMHMKGRPAVGKGTRVSAGEAIGRVGDTGRATGCHLHFEMWSGPGWYDGGSPINPKPYLRRWDRQD